ncbi:MAG: reductive dehalogenase [Candidatus Zixiibacteriota bacterium]|nr:MAG: reductive dehalogenase [candidate division Zixibacteria bacterium]
MSYLDFIYLITGGAVCILLELFALTSIRENQPRAASVSSSLVMLVALLWFGAYFAFTLPGLVMVAAVALVVLFLVLFFLPVGKSEPLQIGVISQRFDERDVVFSREEYQPHTPRYEDYYATRIQFKEADDRIRRLPELLKPGGRYYDPVISPGIDAIFHRLERLTTTVDGNVSGNKQQLGPDQATSLIKKRVLDAGADDVGIAVLNPMFVYSHVGRGPEPWGAPIDNKHKYAIVFTLEMAYERVNHAPNLPITKETASRYLQAARTSIELAEYIRSLGYSARAHIAGSNYQIILPAVAHDAGLGELGRIGYLISPKLGARIRLGGVTTDLPLRPDQPITFGVQDFCARCRKCATNCPAAAITEGDKTDVRGVTKWSLNAEQCLFYWRSIGTDCGLCMKVCPYSHPVTLVHNIVRAGIRRSPFARRVSIWGDDLFYGARLPVD